MAAAAALAVGHAAFAADADDAADAPAVVARVKGPSFGFRVYGLYEANDFEPAVKTFKATLGTATLAGPGGGGDFIWHHLFVRVDASKMEHGGTQVFVFNNQVNSLGIPFSVHLTPIEVSLGWRFARRPDAPWSLYVGGGFIRLRYQESSPFDDPGDTIDEMENGYTVFGGVDVRVLRWITMGGEAQYRGVPNAIGGSSAPVGSPAQAYGESDLGGITARVMIGVGR